MAASAARIAMLSFLRSFALLLLMTLLLGGGSLSAWAQTSPRGAEHETFGRMVFDWNGPVQWSADVSADNKLAVRFDKPLSGDPKTLLKALPKYLKTATLAADRRSVSFDLARPVQLKTFQLGNATVIDMTDAKPAETKAAETKAAETKATGAAKPSLPVTDLMVRGGEHTGFNRLVFDWPKTVGYTVASTEGSATIAFDRPAKVNTTALAAALPADVRVSEIKPQDNGTAIVLALPAGMRLRHFTSGPKVAVDLVRAAGTEPPARSDGAPPPPLAPAMGTSEPLPTPAPAPDSPSAPIKAEPPAPMPSSPAAPTLSPPPLVRPEPTAAEPPPPPPKPVALVSLGVPFDQPTGAAIFRRAGWLWLVFDRKTEVDTKLLRRTGGDVVTQVEQVPGLKTGTALRLLTRTGYNPSVRKEGSLWVFDMAEQPLTPKATLPVNRQFDFEDRGRLLIPVADAPAKPIIFRDPEVGDQIQVMPVPAIGAGIRDHLVIPGAELLPTGQGIALLPLADGVRLDADRNGVEVSMPGGLYLSRDLPAPGSAPGAGSEGEGALISPGGPVDLSRWMRGGTDKFVPEHQKLMNRMAYIRPEEKNGQRLEVARHYLANGMAAEALGVLRLIAQTDPTMVDTANFAGVHGVAQYMMGHYPEAERDLSNPALAKDPQAQLWLAAARSKQSDQPSKQALLLRLAPEDMKGLHARLRMALGTEAVRSTAAAGDSKGANRIIEAMAGPGLSPRDLGTISHMQGIAAQAGKQWDQAIAKYQEAEDSQSRPDRAYAARARIELQLKRGLISTGEAIHQLEKLRFAWRGEDFEYQLLKRLGELLVTDGRYAEALRMMRSVVGNFPEHPDVATVQQAMSDTFEKLFLGGLADTLSPVAAIGLYDEFQDLTPSGTKGDEMIRKLADRLAAVDLLDRSAELLRHQVRFRLSGVEKARVGARLAFLQLSDRKPGPALEALDTSEVPDQPAELYDQRRYMRVRALADLGRSAEALALILNDNSERAKELRAEIFQEQKRWPEVVTALEQMVEPPFGNLPIEPKMARRLIDLATAMILARDERGLARLRRTFGPKMAKTDFREAFALLTAEPERGIIDPASVADKIKQVQSYQSFMADWTKRMQSQGLSSIN
ncbi:tetratricopeptide repeat protein [Magnetospirillum sulfuroxidans]|uniref:Tetratricopeptide repeat protein n=1 Tax=Magnetospirillum sulfuroxidans TaxID=611300 RepID=A0ABS5IFL5_9PROT|nr:tetratricopeptide repeat protein [Magnetospirillum sulfuroxidans]MBR9973213.1 tetratricopeptide repeat protein [Magnetospirillum sulfuroxidans]